MKVKSSALIDQLPFWHTNGDLMVYSDGSLGVGFKIKGVDISCATNASVNDIASSLENLISSTQEGIKLQFFYRLTPNVSSLLNTHQEISNCAPSGYAPIAKSRIGKFKDTQREGNFYAPEIYLFVRSKKHELVKQKFWESSRKFEKISKKSYEEHKQKFVRAITQIESSLDNANLNPSLLDKSE